jgi:hypothetical protein
MTDSERTAILTQAADAEARRQAALQRGDQRAAWHAERELAALWRRYGQLERRAG